jgi:hypothetical protein
MPLNVGSQRCLLRTRVCVCVCVCVCASLQYAFMDVEHAHVCVCVRVCVRACVHNALARSRCTHSRMHVRPKGLLHRRMCASECHVECHASPCLITQVCSSECHVSETDQPRHLGLRMPDPGPCARACQDEFFQARSNQIRLPGAIETLVWSPPSPLESLARLS